MCLLARLKEVKQDADSAIIKDAEDLIGVGRNTVVSYMCMEGLVQSISDSSGKLAKGLLDSAIESMDGAKIVQTDVNEVLWHFVCYVLKGEKLV